MTPRNGAGGRHLRGKRGWAAGDRTFCKVSHDVYRIFNAFQAFAGLFSLVFTCFQFSQALTSVKALTEVEVVASTASFRQLAKCRPRNGDRILEIGWPMVAFSLHPMRLLLWAVH